MGNLLVIGSSNRDLIMQVPKLPAPGETVGGGVFSSANGGKGANQAVAAARAGVDVTFITALGSDSFGSEMRDSFEKEGIDLTYAHTSSSAATGTALIFIGSDAENCIGVAPGANGELSPEHILSARDAFSKADYVLLQLEIPLETVVASINLANEYNRPVILNPAPAQKLSKGELAKVQIIVPNETEAKLLSGEENENSQLEKLADLGIGTVILTQGSRGATIVSAGSKTSVPARVVEAVDTTAAGDVFCGNLAARLVTGDSIEEATKFATIASSIAVTRLGAQPSAPHQKEVNQLLESN